MAPVTFKRLHNPNNERRLNTKNEFQQKLDHSGDQPPTIDKKVVVLDDAEFELVSAESLGEVTEVMTPIGETEDIDPAAPEKQDKTKNAKTPLPKPKNPPKLPE